MGTHFKVVTDHNALKALVNKASLKSQLACWVEYLMGFDIEYCNNQGKNINIADTLSRSMFNQELKN